MSNSILRAVQNAIGFPPEETSGPFVPMWIDLRRGKRELRKKMLDQGTRQALEDLMTKGLAVLRGNISAALCDQVLDDFAKYCATHPEHTKFQDQHGLHDRLACLHMESASTLELGFNPGVQRVIETAFGREATIIGSLLFERGSEQDIHRDTPAFFTVPLNHFFGAWTALEDIQPDSGQLRYYEGGHRVLPDRDFVGTGNDKMGAYFPAVVAACEKKRCRLVDVNVLKGDTVIWHPQLPHGGGPIKNPRLSRKSLVFHYAPKGVPCYGADSFFNPTPPSPLPNLQYIEANGRSYVNQVQARFFHNRKEGNFDEA